MKDWYLIGSPSLTSGGFENDAFNNYKTDAIYDALDTELADSVIVYNYDLSEAKEVRCIVQGNVADTKLKSLERTILFPIGTVMAGQYVYFDDNYWLIVGYPGNNKVYEKVTVSLCQYLLRWQNESGKIIERWISHSSASKYDVGEKGSKVMVLASDDFLISIPNDKESLKIDGKRVFIDTNTENPKKTFKITRNNDTLYAYGSKGGVLSLIADRDEFNPNTDNQALMICDYIAQDEPSSPAPAPPLFTQSNISSKIEGRKVLKLGCRRTYKAKFFDANNEPVNAPSDFSWNILCDFSDVLEQEVDGSSISFLIDNDDYLGEKFALQVLIGGHVADSMTITVSGVYGA